jgi:hypothetical protein
MFPITSIGQICSSGHGIGNSDIGLLNDVNNGGTGNAIDVRNGGYNSGNGGFNARNQYNYDYDLRND